MRFKKCYLVLTLALLGSLARASEVQLTTAMTVQNQHGTEGAWWACAETAANKLGIKELKGLAGLSKNTPATDAAIKQVLSSTNTKLEANPRGNTYEGYEWISQHLEAGVPVIYSYQEGVNQHTVLMLGFNNATQSVHYYDSDTGKNASQPWSWVVTNWRGRAFVVLPEVMPPAQGERPSLQQTTQNTLRPIVVKEQLPPIYPHQLPYVMSNPYNAKPVVIPSNQDIKDGIQRPDDTLRFGLYGIGYGLGSNDYYREFRKDQK